MYNVQLCRPLPVNEYANGAKKLPLVMYWQEKSCTNTFIAFDILLYLATTKCNCMKDFISIALWLIILLALFSCGSTTPRNMRYINSPAGFSPTFFKNKGDAKFSAEYANTPKLYNNDDGRPQNKSQGINVQGAYAFTDHFMMTLGAYHRSETDYYNDNDITLQKTPSHINYKRNIIDAGFGYYTTLTPTERSYFNAIAGFNVGGFKSVVVDEVTNTSYYFNARANNFYFMPGINFFFTPYFRMSLSSRLSFLKYTNIQTNYSESKVKHVQYDFLYKKTFTFLEPSIAFQFGLKKANWLKFDLGTNFSSQPNLYREHSIVDDSHNLQSRTLLLNFGISVYPHKRKR